MTNEIVFKDKNSCFRVAKELVETGFYVVMISREDGYLWILSYVYADDCDRNFVSFMSVDELEEKYVRLADEKDIEDDPVIVTKEIDGNRRNDA